MFARPIHRGTAKVGSSLKSTLHKAKKFILTKHFESEPKPNDLTLVEFELPALKNGEILAQAEYLSVDPYMRAYTGALPTGITMIGGQVAKIIESKNPNYPVGKHIVGYWGWTSHHVFNPDTEQYHMFNVKPQILPDFSGLPRSLALGALGMTGCTAYFGLTEICQPKAGETLVVSGAAGAVGSHVGQIGKILGMKVIGIAGSDTKCKSLIDEYKFDHVINYKTDNVSAALKKAAPEGVDCYFDNVGGDLSNIVGNQMNLSGRISVCGSISYYHDNLSNTSKTIIQRVMVANQLRMEGFRVIGWIDRWMEAFEKNKQWIHEGKLQYRETVTEGFENMYKAFAGMLKGENFGKAVVKV